MKQLLAILLFTAAAQAQNAFPAPQPQLQFTTAGGPLAGGKLCTYVSNTTTPLATYTDGTASVANSNPVVLDTNGSASVWLTPAGLYTFVLRSGGDGSCTTGTVLWTQNGVGITAAGLVNALAIPQLGTGAKTTGGYIDVPPITGPQVGCTDAFGNPVEIPVRLGGLPAIGKNDVVMWNSPSPLPGVNPGGCAISLYSQNVYGLNINTYVLAQGGFATFLGKFDEYQASYDPATMHVGGYVGGSFTAGTLYPIGTITSTGTLTAPAYLGGYMLIGHSAGPPVAGTIASVTNPLSYGEGLLQGMIYFDDTLKCGQLYNGTGWNGFGCGGSGGMPGGGTASIQINNGAGGFGGDANFTYVAGTAVTLGGGASFFVSDPAAGFDASACTATNCIQAPLGGILGLTLRTTDSVIWVEEAAPSLSSAGQARIYDDSTAHALMVSLNGGAYSTFGTGTVTHTAGALTQYAVMLGAGAADSTVVSGLGTAGYVLTSNGVAAAPTWQNVTGTGTVTHTGGALTASLPIIGNGGGDVKPGTVSGNTTEFGTVSGSLVSGDCLKADASGNIVDQGSPCGSASAGVSSIASGGSGLYTGAITLTGTANQVIITPTSGPNTFTFSLPQSIATGSAVTFGSVTIGGAFTTSQTGSSYAFVNSDGSFSVTGTGVVTASGSATFANVTAGSNSGAGVIQPWCANTTAACFQLVQTGSGGSITPIQMDGQGDLSISGQFVINYGGGSYRVQSTGLATSWYSGSTAEFTVNSLNGLITDYAGHTVGTNSQGVSWIPATYQATGQTGSISAQSLQVGGGIAPAGQYRISATGGVTTAGTGGTLFAYVSYTGAGGTSNQPQICQFLATAGGTCSGSVTIYTTGAANIQFSTTASGFTGSPQYSIYVTLERLQ